MDISAELICPADQVFDRAAFEAQLYAASPDTVRADMVAWLRDMQKLGRARIKAGFIAAPFAARPMTRAYTHLTDQLVIACLDLARHLHPNPNPTAGERLSVIAVGGYGRGEMAPFSDVDLLFLTPYKVTAWAESVIESMLYMLWDLKLKVGHASRTIADCVRLGAEDFTIRTAMLEHRSVTGDLGSAKELGQLWEGSFHPVRVREFIEAKLEERDKPHDKQGQRYVVEPNVKEGKGRVARSAIPVLDRQIYPRRARRWPIWWTRAFLPDDDSANSSRPRTFFGPSRRTCI